MLLLLNALFIEIQVLRHVLCIFDICKFCKITEAWRSQGVGVGVYTEHLARLKRIVKEGGGGSSGPLCFLLGLKQNLN